MNGFRQVGPCKWASSRLSFSYRCVSDQRHYTAAQNAADTGEAREGSMQQDGPLGESSLTAHCVPSCSSSGCQKRVWQDGRAQGAGQVSDASNAARCVSECHV